MKVTVIHPIANPDCSPELLTSESMRTFARGVEDLGFNAIAFTDHPAPSRAWMDTGGHASLDPFSALAFCAAVTTRVRLMTYLLVLPYRNPLLAAKSITSLDLLSDGRVVLAVGSGYLKGEFHALGVDFARRNEYMDQALDVFELALGDGVVTYDGTDFTAREQLITPAAVQSRIPILVGGNTAAARQRAADRADGWTPLLNSESAARRTRTAQLTSTSELGERIQQIRDLVKDSSRPDRPMEFQADGGALNLRLPVPDTHLDVVHELSSVGVTSIVIRPPSDSLHSCMTALTAYAENYLPQI